jgi:hypothetical protein
MDAELNIHIALPANRTARPLSLDLMTPGLPAILVGVGKVTPVTRIRYETSNAFIDARVSVRDTHFSSNHS